MCKNILKMDNFNNQDKQVTDLCIWVNTKENKTAKK